MIEDNEEEESEDEDEEMEQNENDISINVDEDSQSESSAKRRKLDLTGPSDDGGSDQPGKVLPDLILDDTETKDKIFTNVNPDLVIQFAETSEMIEDAAPEPEVTRAKVVTKSSLSTIPTRENSVNSVSVSEDKNEEDESDFEIPDIDVGDDSDDE